MDKIRCKYCGNERAPGTALFVGLKLSETLSEKMELEAAKGLSKSAILRQALMEYFDRREVKLP
jgi:hypothetical protein